MALLPGIDRAYVEAEAKHFLNSPAHASAHVHQLRGLVNTLDRSKEDDPLLYAYQCLDLLPKMAGLIIAIEKWAHGVTEATPDQIQEHGAQLCP